MYIELYIIKVRIHFNWYCLTYLKSVSFKKTVEISSTQEICTEFTHIIYCKWVNSVQISWVLEISTVFLKETDFRPDAPAKN